MLVGINHTLTIQLFNFFHLIVNSEILHVKYIFMQNASLDLTVGEQVKYFAFLCISNQKKNKNNCIYSTQNTRTKI